MTSQRVEDAQIVQWQRDGWVLIEGLVPTDEIAAACRDLAALVPTLEEYHADPVDAVTCWVGPERRGLALGWPRTGPGFRAEQNRWEHVFPFPGSGALNRLCVHPKVISFVRRALETSDIRLYQAGLDVRYSGDADYEQPMHLDSNHSLLPARGESPWWHMETFLYLADVGREQGPTHLVRLPDSNEYDTSTRRLPLIEAIDPRRRAPGPVFARDENPTLYAREVAAVGAQGSLLAYRPDVYHRGVEFDAPRSGRFLLNLSFKRGAQDWVGYHSWQPTATNPEWKSFVAQSTPDELSLFGFPRPGHPIWNRELVDATARRYPGLDMTSWYDALART